LAIVATVVRKIMNRIGLAAALCVAVVVGVAFGVYPQRDLDVSALFFDAKTHAWMASGKIWFEYARDAARILISLIVAPAGLAIAGKLIFPRARMLIPGRAALFLVASIALGPGILANTILKDHWGRHRPAALTQFGGNDQPFTAWWDPRGPCIGNCSFIAGEPSGAFWTLAPAALTPPQWRALAYGGAIAFGVAVGFVRIAGGGHFFTDVAFAGVFMFLLTWLLHGLIYRWPRTRLTDQAVERPLARPGEDLRRAFAALLRKRSSSAPRRRS
jgi:lipid A 4'-phosphatase